MARESSLTFEQIAAAADRIAATGATATARAVRDALGTGSMATILKHLNRWKAERSGPAPQPDLTIDPAVAKAIHQHVVAKVGLATAEVNGRLALLQSEMDALIAEGEHQAKQIDERDAEVDRLRAENAELTGRAGQMAADVERLTEALAAARGEIGTLKVKMAAMEVQVESLPAAETEVLRLRDELAAARTEANEQRVAAASVRAELKVVEQARKRAEQQADEAMGQLRKKGAA